MAGAAKAHWQSLDFDLTAKDGKAYTTDIPDGAFGPQGLTLDLKGGASYQLLSKQVFSGDFSFDVTIDIPERSDAGKVWIDVVLVNDEKKRKAVGTFENSSPKPGSDRATVQYFKDGKAVGFQWNKSWADTSGTAGHTGNMEVLRMHKAGTRVFFMQKMKGQAYHWGTMSDYPKTTYFKEDCESFQVGIVVRSSADCTAKLNIKKMQISGMAVLPRDNSKRLFLFDFGPVQQELEDEFMPVSEYTRYSKENGYGWIIPEPEKIVYARENIPGLTDKEIAAQGFVPLPTDQPDWYIDFVRQCYWCQLNDKKVFYSSYHGGDFIEFFQQWLDLKTPLERDAVGMGRPYQFAFTELYQKDIEERRGSMYIDDDLSAEFAVDIPNGRYNMIVGIGYPGSWFGGGEIFAYNMEVEGRVRKQDLRTNWRRSSQNIIRDVEVKDGQMNVRFFCDVRKAMDPFANHNLAVGWMINYMVILPAEDRELLNTWEWKIIKRRGEIIRKVTFVEGEPAVTRKEANFVSLSGKPFYFLKTQNNYHPGDTDHFNYYCLTNTISAESHTFSQSQHFFKPDWEKLSYSDDYPWDLIDHMNTAYSWQYLTSMHQNNILSFVPHAVTGEGNPTVDSRGRKNRYNIQPPLNSALGKEIQKEAYTMQANQLAEHPANFGQYIYEEFWHPDQAGYDEQSIMQYWDWLRTKYKTIEALNADWGSEYKTFDEISPPVEEKADFWQFSPAWVNFRIFRAWASRQMIKHACELVHELEPGHITWGAKGDFGTQSWYPGEYLDQFGWYSPCVSASVAKYFGKSCVTGGYQLNCEYAYLDGRKQFDHKPGPRKYLGKGEYDIYNELITSVFKGVKGFWNEWYSDGMSHAFHRTQMIKELGPQFKVKHWTGQIAFYEDGAYQGPPVKMERNALAIQAANQMLYRIGHLWLPARPMEPKVLFPMVETSYFLDFFAEKPYADFEGVSMRVLQSSNLPAEFIEAPAAKDFSKYQLIVLADMATAISKADADRIRKFVASGGKLIMLDAAGFSDADHPRRYYKRPDEVYPLEEFADLGGYRIAALNAWHMTLGPADVKFAKCDIAPEFSDGQSLGKWDINYYYELPEGSTSTAFLKGTLEKGGKEVVMGLVNKDRNVCVISMPGKGAKDELVHPIAKFVRKLIDTWKIDGRVTIGGVDDAWDLYAGCLEGDGYRLLAACNSSDSKPYTFPLMLQGLPAGQYAVIDVTGQKPILGTKPDGGPTLAPEPPEVRVSKISMVMSADQIAKQGIPTEVQPRQGQVWLIRPMEQKVWNSVWPGSLGEFSKHGVTVAYGTGAADKASADKIVAAIGKMGFKAQAVPAADVKLKKLHHEVRINPNTNYKKPKEDTSKWYLLDTFDNEVVDTDRSLIVVGSEETNSLQAHLGKKGTFVYDKVGEKITSSYPGAGRGAIGWVDAVNSAVYDMQSQTRDGIVVGGSDAAGTSAAADALCELILKHATVREVASRPSIGSTSATKPATKPATSAATAASKKAP